MIDDEIDSDFDSIIAIINEIDTKSSAHDLKIKLRIHKDEYYKKVNSGIKSHP